MEHVKRRKGKRRRRRRKNFMVWVVMVMALLCSVGDMKKGENDTYRENAVNENVYSDASKEELWKEGCFISMKGLSQDGIPTGCESVSTVMALQFMDVEITPEEFIRNYLPCENFWKEDGKIYGPNPKECFAGNPYEAGSLGCFAGVIEKSLKDMKKANYPGMENIRIENVSGMELRELAETYISRKIPVIVWITIDMEPSYEGMEYYLEDGSLYVWRAREHCMVLCGFDRNQYYLMDPLSDGRMVSYALETVEARYEELGMQAIVLEPDRNET